MIALDTPFNNEVLCEDLYGIYFSKNEDSVCKMINYADDNYRLIKKMKKNSIKAINKKFRWDHIVDEYEKVFRINLKFYRLTLNLSENYLHPFQDDTNHYHSSSCLDNSH